MTTSAKQGASTSQPRGTQVSLDIVPWFLVLLGSQSLISLMVPIPTWTSSARYPEGSRESSQLEFSSPVLMSQPPEEHAQMKVSTWFFLRRTVSKMLLYRLGNKYAHVRYVGAHSSTIMLFGLVLARDQTGSCQHAPRSSFGFSFAEL